MVGWVIDNFIAYYGASYTRGFTVYVLLNTVTSYVTYNILF